MKLSARALALSVFACSLSLLLHRADSFVAAPRWSAPARAAWGQRSAGRRPSGTVVEMGARGGGLVRRDESRRQSRVSQMVKTEVSEILLLGHGINARRPISDELRRAISIVDVDVSPDLRNCNIYVSVRGDAVSKREAFAWLVKNTRSVRHLLAQRNRGQKRIPQILFKEADVSAAVDIMQLIEQANSGGAAGEAWDGDMDFEEGFDDEDDLEMFMDDFDAEDLDEEYAEGEDEDGGARK